MQPSLQKWRRPFIGAQWLFLRSGPGATNHFEGGGFARSNEDVAYPNLMFHFLPLAIRYDGSAPAGGHGYQVHIGPMYSDARGSVKITSTDPTVHPALRFNYLSTEQDRREWVEAIHVARRILGQKAFEPFSSGEISPGPSVTTDEQILDWVARDGETALHPSCTAPDGHRRGVGGGPAHDGRARDRGAQGGGRVRHAVRHQREHLRAGDDGGREGRGPGPGQHAAGAGARRVLPAPACVSWTGQRPAEMTSEHDARRELLERLAAGPATIATVARRVAAAESLSGTPPGEWTPREVVAHLAAVEAAVFQARLDQLASEPEPVWSWTEPGPLDTPETATLDGALEQFAALRSGTLARVTRLDEAGWSRAGTHATYGRLDVAGLLGVVVDHDDEHLAGLETRGR